MSDPKPNRRRWRSGPLVILAVIVALAIGIHWLGFLKPVDDHLYDLSMRLRGDREPDSRILIIAVDEAALAGLGPWPLPRRLYADLLQRLMTARAVAFDILFAEPSPDDTAFDRMLQAHGRTVLPVYLLPRGRIVPPVAGLHPAATGHVHLEPDVDGIVRRVHHLLRVATGPPVPSLAAATCALSVPAAADPVAGLAHKAPPPPPAGRIAQGAPMDINFYGGQETYATVSLLDVLQDRWPPEFFRDKIVLVGVTAVGIEPQRFTPISQDRNGIPGVALHGQILNNLLDGSALRLMPPVFLYGLGLLLAVGGLAAFRRMAAAPGAIAWLVATTGCAGGAGLLMAAAGFWIAPAILMLLLSTAFVEAYIVRLQEAGARLAAAKRDWQDAFGTIDDAITIHDPDGRLMRINRAADDRFGRWLADLLTERSRRLITSLKEDSPAAGAPFTGPVEPLVEQIHVREKDRHLEVKTLLRRDTGGRLLGLVQVARDISAQTRLEAEQEALRTQIIQNQKMEALGTLAGGIAHDFNNILSALSGFADLAAMDVAPGSRVAKNIGNIQEVCRRAEELVAQILSFSRQRPIKPVAIQPAVIVKEIMKLMRVSLPRNIDLHTDLHSSAVVLADPVQIHQVLLNLCTNAGHAMRGTGGTLTIEMSDVHVSSGALAEALPGDYVKLRVSDTGHGIPPEIVDRIFKPFFTTKRAGEGTGMGLATVREILDRLGAVVTVDSAPGHGTTFEVFLPVTATGGMGPASVTKTPRRPLALLVADDEPFQVDLLSDLLRRMDHTVTAAPDGFTALALIRAAPQRFDLVIADLDMPDLSGDHLAEQIRALAPNLPVILAAGFSTAPPDVVDAGSSVCAWVRKPFVAEEIALVLEKACPRPEQKVV